MGRSCSVCADPGRQAVDEALLAGEPYRNIAQRSGISLGALSRHRAHAVNRNTPLLFRNSVVCGDALAQLARLPARCIDVWWSSPPFNNADDFRGGNARQKKVSHLYAGGNGRGDGCLLPEAEYQAQQVRVLTEWHRTLADDGVAFYQHKVRPKDRRTIHPLEWVARTPFVLVGHVTWARRGTPNTDPRRFYPTTEVVLLLAKRPGWYVRNVEHHLDVWPDVKPQGTRKATGHPCVSPRELVRRCLANLRPFADRRRPLVADCYAGTGTTGLVAREVGMDYLLIEREPEYVDRIRAALAAPRAAPLALFEEAAG